MARVEERPQEVVKVENVAPKVEASPKVEPVKVEMPKRRPSILSLGDLLGGGETPKSEAKKEALSEQQKTTEKVVEQGCDKRLEEARGAIMSFLESWRPRFIAVFEPMIIEGNVMRITVPTEELKEEILRNKTELLTHVVKLASIKGAVELEIEVSESEKSFKPIKLEDRIAYMMELNPVIVELKEALDLDVEG